MLPDAIDPFPTLFSAVPLKLMIGELKLSEAAELITVFPSPPTAM